MSNNPVEKAQNSIEHQPKAAGEARGGHSPDAARPPSGGRRVWSVLVGIIIVLSVALSLWIHHQRTANPVSANKGGTVDRGLLKRIPNARFTDITASAGIRFVHHSGAYGEKLLPETTGGGCAFFDFDNDGDPDILFVNSTDWPWKMPEAKAGSSALALYQNDGAGSFQDVTAGSGLDMSLYGMGVAVGDYDNDGRVDLFISTVGANHLFRNLGQGKFTDVTAQTGVAGEADEWSTSSAFIDYDNDGDLDLFVCNYVQWSYQIDLDVNYQLPGLGRAYGPPMNFVGTYPYLYRNDGNGRFTDISASSGIRIKKPGTDLPMAKSLGVAPVDFDGDGWIDLIVANDTVQNFAFHNQQNGMFKEVGAIKGLAYSSFGGVRGAMGIDSSRFEDDNLAVAIGNFANEMTALYVNQRDPFVFSDEAIRLGIGAATKEMLTFGVFFFDYDLDGWLDLLTANGHIEPDIAKVHPNQQYKQSARLFWNARGTGRAHSFVPVPPQKCGADIFTAIAGRGSAFADIDGDGDPDVLLTQIDGPPLLLRNDQKLNHHWIRLKLVGKQANRDAIGAWVKVRTGNKTLSRQVMPTRGFLSQSELPVTFGLGPLDRVESVSITWPGGVVQAISGVRVDALTVVEQKR